MKKFLIFLPLFLLFAKPLDFSVCYKKFFYINKLVPVTKTKSVTFTKPKKFIFFDPFTHLYVISTKNRRYIHFSFNPRLGWWMAGIKKNSVFAGSFAKEGYFLNFSHLSVKTEKNSIISDMFCRAYGVSSGNGFLGSKKLLHFVKYGYWGDIGIEVDEKMRVIYSDPFYTDIKPGEKIISINNKKATPLIYEKYVLLSTLNKKVLIKTNIHKELLKVRKKKFLFTPLEYYGVKVDKNLIAYLPKNLYNRYFLKKGKIIKVNDKKVTSFKDLNYLLSFNKNVTITLESEGILINIPLR